MSYMNKAALLNIKKSAIGLGCGLIFGFLILGIGGRLLMRLIAMLAHVKPDLSFGGTLEVIAFGLLVGLPSGLIFVWIGRFIPGGHLLKGSIYGVLVFLVIVLLPGEAMKAALGFRELLPVTVAMFAALFTVFGIVLAKTVKKLDHSLE